MNKKQLYESIMKNVSKEVKKAINEELDEPSALELLGSDNDDETPYEELPSGVWISTYKQLPNEGELVLVKERGTNKIMLGYFSSKSETDMHKLTLYINPYRSYQFQAELRTPFMWMRIPE